MPSTLVLGSALFLVAWVIIRLSKLGSREPSLPPGPPTIPLLGNMLDFPKSRVHLKFTEWARQYGDLFSLKIGNSTIVVVSSAKMLRECMDSRGATMSDRPHVYVAELVNGGLDMPWSHYGPTWRNLRRASHDMLTKSACDKHLPIQRAEATQLMADFLDTPDRFYTHIFRYSASVILSVVFGVHCASFEGSFIEEFHKSQRNWDNLLRPGASPPVEVFPILKYIPRRYAPWKDKCDLVRQGQTAVWRGLLTECIERMNNGKRNEAFLEYVIDHKEKYNLDETLIGYLGFALIEAGVDTTSIFLQFFVQLMSLHPDVRQRAQKEIDDVVGSNRTPTMDDLEHLPFVKAIINEVNRYRPFAPTGVPHASTADEHVGQYVVPKGATVFMNMWGIFRDEEVFENPEEFNPDRYMKSKFGTKPGADTTGFREDIIFGSGRRICPGMHLASNSIALNVMNLLWAFDFNHAKDPLNGQPIPIDPNAFSDGIVLSPEPFKCDIRPRSQAKAELIRKELTDAKSVFEQFEPAKSKV
ncbi:unnamed protein product [Somion occarium]|uniref:Cytochrome P450 n=1 Tax=Somion occarium TaxID=3059160 RepID=A0ABP1DFL7_9APHY